MAVQSNTKNSHLEDLSTKKLTSIDKSHIWHPFTPFSIWLEDDPIVVQRGEGNYLFDVKGDRYLDGVSSIWCNVHGYSNPIIQGAMEAQLKKISHSTMLGLTHEPVIVLSEKLIPHLPKGLTRLFYADSGSNAVEAAIRMAVESYHVGGKSTKRKFLGSLDYAYHGDTLGSVGVGYLEAFHKRLSSVTVQAKRIRPPHVFSYYLGASKEEALESAILEAKEFFKKWGEELCAFIIEPLVQGAAGIWTHEVEYLRAISVLAAEYNVKLIADEVATGFLKTGEMFACNKAGITPDFLVMGKGLSAGMLAISAVATKEEIFRQFEGAPEELKTFFYGQTFAGNPLAAASGVASLEICEGEGFMVGVRERIEYFQAVCSEKIRPLPNVSELRQCGFMTGIELTPKPGSNEPYDTKEQTSYRIVREARRRGVLIRPLGNVMVLMPAPTMPEKELETLVCVTAEAVNTVCG